ncbi:MAG TPA: Ig-like domain-containing protein [Fimbriimonadaceae bacterium]|jgi:hypothetical protein
MRFLTALVLCLVLVGAALCAANTGIIQLSSFPTMEVADGHTPISIDAEVRDSSGKPVPDGTPVVFETNLGSFQNPLVVTKNGVAHAHLIAGSTAGVATITAASVSYGASSTLDYTFVSDRSMLSKAKEYIEVTGDKKLSYSFDQKIVNADGIKRTAYLRYRDIGIYAESLQFDVSNYTVKAHHATVKIGKTQHDYGDLIFILNKREGFGTTTYKKPADGVEPEGRMFKFVQSDKLEDTYGIAEIKGTEPSQPNGVIDPGMFRFDPLLTTTTEITAKKLTVFPTKRIIFEAAAVYMANTRVMKVPLYQLDLVGEPKLFSDQILSVNNSQIAFNYPYYLQLKPGVTSLFRLETGAADSTGMVANRGLFLNYEYNWNKGDDMQGGLTLEGLGRNDWGLKGQQSWHFNNGGSLSTLLELPSHQSLYGSVTAAQPFKGYELTADASAGHTLVGTPFDSQNYNVSLEKNSFKIGNFPANFYVGLEAYSNSTQETGWFSGISTELSPVLQQKISDSQTAVGPQFRGQSQSIKLGATTMNASFSVAKLTGHNTLGGLTYDGNLTFNRDFGKFLTSVLSYSYTEDGFDSSLLGRQQVSLQSTLHKGKARLDFMGIQGIDGDHSSYDLEASYQMTRVWRLGYGYQQERYFGSNYADFDLILGYRIGSKEFGLVWSQKLKRIGFQLLGTPLN